MSSNPSKHPIKIGSEEFDTNIFLAPLAGCSDLSFRLIAREHGARCCFFEMIDAHSVIHGPPKKTLSILKTNHKDAPIAAQLLGADPAIMLAAANRILGLVKISFIDINAACPAKKVLKKRAGSYLLHAPEQLYAVIKKLASSLPIPVTVKIRLGYKDDERCRIVAIAKKCESSGASAIFVHGRTTPQGYSGTVDYDSIGKIKDALKIPVFGSGDILTPESAARMLHKAGCDGIVVARGALGNPWIFAHIERYLGAGETPPSAEFNSKKTVLKRHLAYIEKYKDCSASGKTGFMRKVALWYLKDFPNARKIRGKVILVNTYDKMIELIDTL